MKPGVPSWRLRRRAVFGSLLFSVAVICFVAFKWDDTSLAQTLTLSAFALMGTVVAAYIGGAAYEDVRLNQSKPTIHEETEDDFQ